MEYAGNNSHDSYTRYRIVAVAAMQQVVVRESAETIALLVAVSAFWGYVVCMALGMIA